MTPVEAYIRQVAPRYGIDPNVAVRVAMTEGGLDDPFQQSNVVRNGQRETSFGPFQLRIGGGLGDKALAAGIDPRKNWQGGVDFALWSASQGGWKPWYGAAKANIGDWQGIRASNRQPYVMPTGSDAVAQAGPTLPEDVLAPSEESAFVDVPRRQDSQLANDLSASIGRRGSGDIGSSPDVIEPQEPLLFDFAKAAPEAPVPPQAPATDVASVAPETSLADLFSVKTIGGTRLTNPRTGQPLIPRSKRSYG